MPEIPAARSTLAVLRYLAARNGPVRAATLARDLGIPRSSVYQLIAVMMDEGFVVHYPEDRTYGLSSLRRRDRHLGAPQRTARDAGAPPPGAPRRRGGGLRCGPDRRRTSPCSAGPTSSTPPACRASERRRRSRASACACRPTSPRPEARCSPAWPLPRCARSTRRGTGSPAATTRAPPPSANSTGCSRRPVSGATRPRTATSPPNTRRWARRRLDRHAYPVAAIGLTFRRDAIGDAWEALGSATARSAAALTARLAGRTEAGRSERA